MSPDLIIPLVTPVTVTVAEDGNSVERKVTDAEMREPELLDFGSVSVNEPTIGQMVAVAARCCKNIPPAKFNSMSASNLMAVSRWVGGFLHASR